MQHVFNIIVNNILICFGRFIVLEILIECNK
jgi:hypothetical protein